ncbi:NAD(P)H-binding protein [Gulosibacter sp. 10]|uniref:NAD(P)H-binding protein n=1 Tax=Gulosibacter sp. 10 TaxID=1255570 RepID=UPI00097F1502|nr:NAD(P)H-binding protein [Gulosibacter sp. 10]SJM70144.1 hypothetical protein FM112_14765 [Gulosibacter sp. 10]
MSNAGRIVVLGGHGKVALLAAPRLTTLGYAVDSVIRNPDHAADIEAAGGSPVVLDIESASEEQLAEAFRGADAVVFSAGAGGGDAARTRAVDYEAAARSMAAAEAAGVRRYVLVSYAGAAVDVDRLDPEDSFYPYAKAKHDADEGLRATGLDYTILGPGMLTLEDATGEIDLADEHGEGREREIAAEDRKTSRANVAEVIAHVIANGAALRETVNFYDGSTPIAEAIR